MRLFKEERDIPGAARVGDEAVAFNINNENIEYAIALLVDAINQNAFIEFGEIIKSF